MKVGLVGLGKMGMLHGAILNALDGADLTAVCEASDALREGFEAFVPGVRFYEDYRRMIAEVPVEAVFITTPTESHEEIGLAFVERGCHVFIEKPLALDSFSSRRLVEAASIASTTTMVGFMMRYVETFQRAKVLLDAGTIGRPISFKATVYTSQLFESGKGWRYSKKASGGGVLVMQGIHALDLLSWYFGLPESLNARTNAPYSGEIEDFAHVNMAWPGGLSGFLDCSWSVDNHRLMETEICVTGDCGTLTVSDDVLQIYLRKPHLGRPAGWTLESKPDLYSGVPIDIGGAHYTREVMAFVEAATANRPVDSDFASGYRVQCLVDAAYTSAKSAGGPVRVAEIAGDGIA